MPFIEHIKPPKYCRHPEHNPPSMIVLPAGTHVYECPACGEQQSVNVDEFHL